MSIQKKYSLPLILLTIAFGLFAYTPTFAALVGNISQATLTISPQTGNYNINDNFTASIYVNTNNQFVNTVAAYLSYDKTHFQAVSIDTSGSLFTMEAENIIDSNNGLIKITRGIPTPGINSANGLVAKINFKALANVTPAVDNLKFNFTPGSTLTTNVFKDDGAGTAILDGVYNAKYTVGTGGPVTYSDGTLLKVTGGTKVYVLTNGKKCWITTSQVFNSQGYNWSDVIEVAQSVIDSYSDGPNVVAVGGSIPEGGLIRAKGDIDVWIVKYINGKQFKRLILSPSVFNSYGHLKWSNVQDVDQSVVDSYVTSDLVRAVNDPKVYKLTPSGDTGQRQWIETSAVFTRMGLDWDSVYQINQVDRDSYVEAAPLE